MKPRVGQSLVSAIDSTAVIVVKAPEDDVTITCGGVEMVEKGQEPPAGATADPAQQAGTQLGKRYADDGVGIELLCTKGGEGTLAVNGTPVPLKDAKPLPASD